MILTTMEVTTLYNMVTFKSTQNQSSAWYTPSMQCDLLKDPSSPSTPLQAEYTTNDLMTTRRP